MKSNVLLISLYIVANFLTFALSLNGEFNYEHYLSISFVTVVLTGMFTFIWTKLYTYNEWSAFHKVLFVCTYWFSLLFICDYLFFHEVENAIALIIVLLMLAVFMKRTTYHHVMDSYMSAMLIIVLYVSLQFGQTILPFGLLTTCLISMAWIVICYKGQWIAALNLARFLFCIQAVSLLLTPIEIDWSATFWVTNAIVVFIVIYYLVGKKHQMLFPQKYMRIIVVIALFVGIGKYFI